MSLFRVEGFIFFLIRLLNQLLNKLFIEGSSQARKRKARHKAFEPPLAPSKEKKASTK